MHYTIERLVEGDPTVAAHFQRARAHWTDLLRDIDAVTVVELASRLTEAQTWFEAHCGGERHEGQEVMIWTAFANPDMYTIADGWLDNEDNGQKLLQAFGASYCSAEVKEWAKVAANYYFLDVGPH